MEGKLIDILIISKKGVQFGENICTKAKIIVQEGKDEIDQLERTWAKLHFLAAKAAVQIRTVDSVAAHVKRVADGLGEYCQVQRNDLSGISVELDRTFHNLRNRKVDEELLRNNLALLAEDAARAAEGRPDESRQNLAAAEQDPKSTLFDYIDDQGVLELERQAQGEIAEVENLRTNLQTISQSLTSRITSFEELLSPAFEPLFDQSGAAFARERCIVQERETIAMADYLHSLTKHYDQVSCALELYQSQTESFSENPMDISVLINDTDEVGGIIEELQKALDIVKATSEEIQERNPIYSNVYNGLVQLFLELEQFGLDDLDGVVEGLKNVEVGGFAKYDLTDLFIMAQSYGETNDSMTEMADHRARITKYFESLWGLVEWYEEFASAYDYLVLEINRRHQHRARHERVVEDYARKLEELYLEEVQERNVWFEAHGRYLPMDLCPPIMDPPVQYDITLVHEGDRVRLPVLTEKSFQEARAGVKSRAPAS